MFRKPVAWIVFIIVAALCGWFTYRNFHRAYPIVTLDLRMDRQTALESARKLAQTHGWGPDDYRQAASFSQDQRVQNFVELEAGGKEKLAEILESGLYHSFRWNVRHFKEGETTETMIRFTPAGEPYGFTETLPEDAPGAQLDADTARPIAEDGATRDWGIDLGEYELVEQAQEERPGGRVDHTFTYERPDIQIGEGRYRLRLVVSGDRFTELTHFVKVPEGFDRRFEEMRSANQAINMGSTVGIAVLYIIGGCGVGLFLLLRKRWVLWKQAVLWALFIAFVQILATFNNWPLFWMNYDTALSRGNFMLQQIAFALLQFLAMGSVMAISFMAAESLTRRAFPKHVQFWKLWKAPVAGTPTVLGFTVAGLLLVTLFLAYDVALYLFAHDKLGWWTPSSALFDPDVLASYFPWLTSIAISLQAGFWEECLFRAVPLACAALIGQKLGGRRWWILGAFVVEALIFGSGHAGYPQQPAYARVVELIIPSVGFGLIYLRYGLLPAIVLHYAVDVAYIGAPLFVSSAPGVWFQQFMVVLLCLVPLWVVLGSRLRNKRWLQVKEPDLNAAWSPPPPAEAKAEEVVTRTLGLTPVRLYVVLALGVAGLLAWIFATDFKSESPPLPVSRSDALAAARQELNERGIEIPDDWRELSAARSAVGQVDRFVWQEGGPDAYHDLLGRYIATPRWGVRYASFTGDVAERAEEYRIWVDGSGEAYRFRHILPEAAPGVTLSEERARELAQAALREIHAMDPAELREVSAEPSKLPNRTDWTFTFADDASFPLDEGEARIGVDIAGDEVVYSYRFVHVPEQWERQERDRATAAAAVRNICIGILFLLYTAGAITAVVMWSRKRFALRAFLTCALLLLALNVTVFFNGWPAMTAQFDTARPFGLQVAMVVGISLVGLLMVSVAIGLNVGFLHRWLPRQKPPHGPVNLAVGVALGLLIGGIGAVAATLGPSVDPVTSDFQGLSAALPLLATGLGPAAGFIIATALALLVFATVDRFTAGWSRRKGLFLPLFLVLGCVMAGSQGVETIPLWLGAGVLTGVVVWALYTLVLRFDWTTIPVLMATSLALDLLREGIFRAYPGALAGAVIAVVIIAVLAWYWWRILSRTVETAPKEPVIEDGWK